MVAVGGIVGVALGKALFGGLGYNAFNPALVGRAFLQARSRGHDQLDPRVHRPAASPRWPPRRLTWPFSQPVYDGLTGATPLAAVEVRPSADRCRRPGHGLCQRLDWVRRRAC